MREEGGKMREEGRRKCPHLGIIEIWALFII